MSIVKKSVVVVALSFLNFLNGTDVYAVAGKKISKYELPSLRLLAQISDFYQIDDSQAGLLQTVYIVTYIISSPLFGYFGDRYNRKWILIAGSTTCALLTLASSFIPKELFWLFISLRAFTGVGDAAVNTIVPTLFGDMFGDKGRSYALMIFYYSLPFGWYVFYDIPESASTVIASQLVDNDVWWQWGLRIVPPFCLATIILLIFLLEEPARTEKVVDSTKTVWTDIKRIVTVPSFLLILVAVAAMNIVTGAQGWWNPTMTQLAMNSTNEDPSIFHGESYGLIMSIIGIDNTAGGIVGTTLSVWISERWTSHGLLCLSPSRRATPLVGAIGDILAFPATMFVQHLYLIDINWNYVLGFYGSIMSFGTYPLCMNVLLRVIPPTCRATATAIYNVFGSVFGDAPSPYVIGAIADSFRDYSAPDQAGDHLACLLAAMHYSNAFMSVCSVCLFATACFIEKPEIRAHEARQLACSSYAQLLPKELYRRLLLQTWAAAERDVPPSTIRSIANDVVADAARRGLLTPDTAASLTVPEGTKYDRYVEKLIPKLPDPQPLPPIAQLPWYMSAIALADRRLLKIIQSDPCTAGSAVARISWLENEIVDKLITFRDINLI
ncbi:hypothetical protein PRIPAC_92224 [Pristionchus pacificus]|uniref:Membrane transporter n=1 Tax=Pristionchus pacificus TaxID=54126 RepID=A0A2A6CDV8_PRIPA|nr:hypothetical protein PRIPAC_92224 [Pristionchus pacificus]|eukprot:PDM76191.1 membrane transporter [Pristionchus pacificus]